jgi:hypothetical protein
MTRGDRPSTLDRPAPRLDRQRIRRRSLLGGLISEYERACGCPKLGPWPLTCCFTAGGSPA